MGSNRPVAQLSSGKSAPWLTACIVVGLRGNLDTHGGNEFTGIIASAFFTGYVTFGMYRDDSLKNRFAVIAFILVNRHFVHLFKSSIVFAVQR